MAEEGRGEVEYVALNDDGSAAARRFHERVRNPLLTDVSIDWSGLTVADVYPKRIPDLFSAKPVILTGRYTGSGKGVIKLRGKMSGRDFVREIPVEFPDNESRHDVLATLWARTRIDNLMSQDWNGIQQGTTKPEVKETITQLGLEYRLMTQFTSFVAVEEMTITDGGVPRRVEVPVELPEGVSREGVFGEDDEKQYKPSPTMARSVVLSGKAGGSGVGYGSGGAVGPAMRTESKARSRKPATLKDGRRTDKSSNRRNPVVVADEAAASPGKKLTLKEQKAAELVAKLHPTIAALVERLKTKRTPDAGEAKFVRDGKAEIQIWLTDKSPEVLAELKKLGFEVVLDPQSAKMVIGRIALDKLAALAEVKAVRYISPQATH